jgi:uncharacterized protein
MGVLLPADPGRPNANKCQVRTSAKVIVRQAQRIASRHIGADHEALMTIGAVFGVAGAWALAVVVSDAAIRLTVGLIGISFVLNAWFRRTLGTKKPTAAGGIVWGALSGFTSTIIQAGAPPFQVFVLPQRLPKMTLVGTMTIFFALVNIMKVAPYLALGQFSPATLATSAILLPIAVAANFAGIWLVRVTSLETFYRLAYWLVLVISAVLAWQGAADLVRS